MNKTLKYGGFIFLLILGQLTYAQSVIKGAVSDQNQQPIETVTVLLKDKLGKSILSYSFTDEEGRFELKAESEDDSLNLEANMMGYKSVKMLIVNKTKSYDISMGKSEIELAELVVKTPPIRRKGDTLSYSVSEFQTASDKSIGDVLQRLPGVSKDAQGNITYQGEQINKYYVEDLDLLGARYDLVNENLPKGKVATIQVLENHQPIRMLDSLEISDRAAINLKLTDKVTKSFTSTLAAGLSPILWDAKITPMVFMPNFQFIASAQSNNVGNDLKRSFYEYSMTGLSPTQDWTGINAPNPPIFSKNRWMDNQSHGFSINTISKLNNDNLFRINSSLYLDRQDHKGSKEQTYFLGDQEVSYAENMDARFNTNQFNIGFKVENNSSRSYFNEELKFQKNWRSDHGLSERPLSYYDQTAKTGDFYISNDFRKSFKRNDDYYDFSSKVMYSGVDQNLKIDFIDVDTTANPVQFFNYKNLGAEHILRFNKKLAKRLNSGISIGSVIELAHVQSDLQDYNDLSNTKNDFGWNSFKTYISSVSNYSYKDWTMRLSLPLTHRFINYKPVGETNRKYSKITPEPSYVIRYRLNSSVTFGGHLSYAETISSIGDIYGGYVMSNYLILNNRNADFRNTQRYMGSFNFNLNDIISGINLSLSYTNQRMFFDQQTEITILDDGSIQNRVGDEKNKMNNQTGRINFSKYFSDLKTTLSTGATYSVNQSNSWINGEKLPYTSKSIRPDFEVSFSGIKDVFLNYRLNYSHIKFDSRSPLAQVNQKAIANITVIKNLSAMLTFEHYQFRQEQKHNFYFGDIGLKYHFPNSKRDLEFSFINLFNQKEYTTMSISNYSALVSSYQLRPRQFLIKTSFGF